MVSADEAAAQGRGYANAARSHEKDGNKEEASRLYLMAAEAFLNGAKMASDPKLKSLRQDMAETFYNRGVFLKAPKKRRIPTSDTEPTGEQREDFFIPMEVPEVTFKDVGGMEGVKEEIRRAIIHPFTHPELYKMYGKSAGESILLYGPPGCGKTFIAKAAAGETRCNFINIRISDVLSMWVGESEKNLQKIFDSARKYAPSIVFFDEIDGIGSRRSGSRSTHAKRLVNELLIAMDGVVSKEEKLLTLAATNEPWSLDPALIRPGRFSKLLFIPPPDLEARKQIFKLGLLARKVASSIDIDALAERTINYSSADIKQICDEAADIPLEEALRGNAPRPIAQRDLEAIIDRRRSSLIPWFRMARQQIVESGEADLYCDLIKAIEESEGEGKVTGS